MALQNDFVLSIETAFLKLFAQDAVLKNYNWQGWESDKPVTLPRGYVDLTADAEFSYGEGPYNIQVHIVMENRFKSQKLSGAIWQLQQIMRDIGLGKMLNALTTSVQFYARAEKTRFSRRREGDIRIQECDFTMYVLPLV